MSPNRKKPTHLDEESEVFGAAEYEECPVCRQEFADGVCPINSADCPYREDAEDDLDEEDDPDFEDVKNLKEILGDDKEADRLTEEEEDFSGEADADEDRER
ncbi:MAG TPA: hypothetical protein PKE12_13010 [Kiritimatiellia bacterium]|nr:hypothetical protein [Kiritimatiellia bacterium]